MFQIFSCPSSSYIYNVALPLSRYRCREAKNLSRAQLCGYHKQLQVLVVEMKFSGDKTRSLFSSTSLILLGMLVTPAVLSSAYYQLFPAGIKKKIEQILSLFFVKDSLKKMYCIYVHTQLDHAVPRYSLWVSNPGQFPRKTAKELVST